MSKKALFSVLLVLGTAFWGISFAVTKVAVGDLPQSTFLFYRFLLASVVLSVTFFSRIKHTQTADVITGMVLGALLTLSINFSTLGIRNAPASQCAFLAGTSVILVPLLKLLIYKKMPDANIWLAAIVALLGLSVISVKSDFTVSTGDMYTLISTLGFGIYLICVESYASRVNIVNTIVPMFVTCTVIMLGVAASDGAAVWLPARPTFWGGILYCALFSTAYVYTVSNMAQQHIPAEKVAIIYLFEPIFAAIASKVILGEALSWRLLLGGALIFAGTVISEVKLRPRGGRLLD